MVVRNHLYKIILMILVSTKHTAILPAKVELMNSRTPLDDSTGRICAFPWRMSFRFSESIFLQRT